MPHITTSPMNSSTTTSGSTSRLPISSSQSTSQYDAAKPTNLASSTSRWSPLRIGKRDSPSGQTPMTNRRTALGPTPVRRTSSSFSHVRNNSLVTNSIFKQVHSSDITSTATPRPTRIPTADRRVSSERRASLEKRMRSLARSENVQPHAFEHPSVLRKRESTSFQGLVKREVVTKSPFKGEFNITTSTSTEDDTSNVDDGHQTKTPEGPPLRPPRAEHPPPLPNSLQATSLQGEHRTQLPSRSNLVSRRMFGPRTSSGSIKRPMKKKVGFDECCVVVEFDQESYEFDDDDVFLQSDQDVDYDPHGPRRMLSSDEEGYDSVDDQEYYSDPQTGDLFVDSMLAKEVIRDNSGGSPLHPQPSTPPSGPLPVGVETEGGIPLGRSHHIERIRAAHAGATPPLTPLRHLDDHDGPPSPSPARSRPATSLFTSQSAFGEDETDLEPDPMPKDIRPLAFGLSDSYQQHVQFGPTSDMFEPASRPDGQPTRSPPKTVLSRTMGSDSNSSLSSLERGGSHSGRSSPRIDREEVRRRLMKSRTSPPVDGLGAGGSDADPSSPSPGQKLVQGDNEEHPLTITPHPQVAHQQSSSVDLHKTGVDLGDVRSALDRLMLGVERGFVDDSSFSQHNESSFAEENIDQSADASIAEDPEHPRYSATSDLSVGEVMGAERAVFTQAQSTQSKHPEIMPPSPLLPSTLTMQAPATSHPPNQSPSTEGTETEDDEPATPSTRSMSSPPAPPAVALLDKVESSENLAPAPRPDSSIGLNLDSKPLPATPQPRLSLDFPISSSFYDSEFRDIIPLSTTTDSDPMTSVGSTSLLPLTQNVTRSHEDAIPTTRRAPLDGRPDPSETLSSERPQRRRSRSAGDVLDSRGEVSIIQAHDLGIRLSTVRFSVLLQTGRQPNHHYRLP